MTQQDTQPPAETLANLRKAAERKIGFTRRGSEDRVLVRRADLQWLLTRRAGGDAIPAGEDADEFATVEEWEHEDQRELSLLYNHKSHDRPQFNRGQMREAIRHGRSLATPKPPAGGDAMGGLWKPAGEDAKIGWPYAFADIEAVRDQAEKISGEGGTMEFTAEVMRQADARYHALALPVGGDAGAAINHARECLRTIGETKHVQIKRDALETILAALALPAPLVEGENTALIRHIIRWIDEAMKRAEKHGHTEGVWLFASQWRTVRDAVAALSEGRSHG